MLDDLNEYIECELRIREMNEEDYAIVKRITEDVINRLTGDEQLTQRNFEDFIARAHANKVISAAAQQGASDLFYVMIVRQNAGNQ